MLIDMHVHSSGISTCCKIPYDEAIRRARDAGIDAIVLTNHYFDGYVTDGDFDAFAAGYVAEYEAYRVECVRRGECFVKYFADTHSGSDLPHREWLSAHPVD